MNFRLPLLLALLSLFIAGCAGGPSSQPAEINISAAISLKGPLDEIQQAYQAKQPDVKLVLNFGASGTLQKQIEQGAPADIFISAAVRQMDELAAKKLLQPGSRLNLLENRLALVVPLDSHLTAGGFETLATPAVRNFSMAEPESVPAGHYGRQVLQKLGIWDEVKPKAVLAKDVRTVRTYVETGNVDAGIVYTTEAAGSARLKIVAVAPADWHEPIVYPAAILAGSKSPRLATDFLAFLSSEQAREIFKKHGFGLVKQ